MSAGQVTETAIHTAVYRLDRQAEILRSQLVFEMRSLARQLLARANVVERRAAAPNHQGECGAYADAIDRVAAQLHAIETARREFAQARQVEVVMDQMGPRPSGMVCTCHPMQKSQCELHPLDRPGPLS